MNWAHIFIEIVANFNLIEVPYSPLKANNY